jgi:3-hydroxyacyl-[acyl-carrier-protein] dehydratase
MGARRFGGLQNAAPLQEIVTMSDEVLQTANAVEALTPEEEGLLRDALKRCSTATIDAAIEFRRTGAPELIPPVVLGIVERFVEPDQRQRLKHADPNLRIIEDLGVDSLTLMEVVLLVEESLKITIKNDEHRNLRTIGDIQTFIDCKVTGKPVPTPTRFLPIERIAEVMPVQPPFLFLQDASVNSALASGRYKVSGSEFFLQGHFKDNPVLPASIMLEALGQLAVLYLLESGSSELTSPVDARQVYFTGADGIRCHKIVRPGDALLLTIRPKRMKMPLAVFEGTIKVGTEKAAFAEEITLAFGYVNAAAVAAAPELPAAHIPGTNGTNGATPHA